MPVTTSYTPTEILAFGPKPCALPVTIKSNVSLPKGQVIARLTATGLYEAYNNAGSGGVEVASGILAEAVDTTSAGTNRATEAAMYVGGNFVESRLTGLDSNAITDLNGRSVPGRDLFIF